MNARLTEQRVTKNGDIRPNHNAEHHRSTKQKIVWYFAECVTYSTNYQQRLTLGSWFTNLEKEPLNRCQQLPAPYKRLIHNLKGNRQTTNGSKETMTQHLTNHYKLKFFDDQSHHDQIDQSKSATRDMNTIICRRLRWSKQQQSLWRLFSSERSH